MLFLIEEEIVNAKDELFLQCLDVLLLGYIEGNHLLFIKPKTVKLINRLYSEKMDERTRNLFIHYEENFMVESKVAYNLMNHVIKIIPTKEKEETVSTPERAIRCLHTTNFLRSSNIQKTVLLGENSDDGDIYEIMAKEFIKKQAIGKAIKVQCKIENGGGNTTAPTFKRKVEQKEELCLCILDSDKKYPTDPSRGETARRLAREVRNQLTPKYHYYVEDRCRELENMLPESFYQHQYGNDINKKGILPKLKMLKEAEERSSLFFDMKKGLKCFDVTRCLDTKKKDPQWSFLNNNDFGDPPCDTQQCTIEKTVACNIVDGFGTKILEHFISFYNNAESDQVQTILSTSNQHLAEIWKEIGNLVLSWCCGQDPSLPNT